MNIISSVIHIYDIVVYDTYRVLNYIFICAKVCYTRYFITRITIKENIMEETKELKEELKVKSFRISEETHDKFKEIANGIGGNQQETFNKLIEAYELQQGRLALKEEGANVDQFQKYVACLTRMYIGSLEDKENVRATVRTEFDTALKSKDDTILDLQGQLKKAKEEKEEAIHKLKATEKEVQDLNQYNIEQEKAHSITLNGLQDTLEEKEATLKECKNLNSVLTGSHDRLEKQVEQMKAEIGKAKELEKELENLQKEHDKLTIDFNVSQANLSNLKEKHEQTIKDMENHEKEALERVREQFTMKLDKAIMEKEHQKELKELQQENWANMQKYFDNLSKQPRDNNSNNNKRRNTGQPKNNPKVTDTEQTTEQ